MIPYARQTIAESDIAAVVETLRSDWLTTGPKVADFESHFAQAAGARYAVALNSGTAALHAAMDAYGVGPGDEVIVPANTFVATANAVLYAGAKPVFADIDPQTFLLDAGDTEKKITPRTRGIVAVDFAGQPCDYGILNSVARRHGLFLHADACHALGATYKGKAVGSLADTSSFSFHPVKPITTAEGGMITTDDEAIAERMKVFRNHGITVDFRQREKAQTWEYDMETLGWNYRLSDLQCALGLSQLRRSEALFESRNQVAKAYNAGLGGLAWLKTPLLAPDRTHAYHLYPCLLTDKSPLSQRDHFQKLRRAGIGVHVMYRPVYQHSYYQKTLGERDGQCPVAESVYRHILILPIFPSLSEDEIQQVISAVRSLGD